METLAKCCEIRHEKTRYLQYCTDQEVKDREKTTDKIDQEQVGGPKYIERRLSEIAFRGLRSHRRGSKVDHEYNHERSKEYAKGFFSLLLHSMFFVESVI